MRTHRIGEKVVLLYALATYLPQFVLHWVSEEPLVERFHIGTGSQAFAAFIPAFLLLFWLLNRLLPRVTVRATLLRGAALRIFESPCNVLLGAVLIGLAAHFSRTQGVSFRQSGDAMRDAGLAVELLMFAKPYVYAWLLYHFIRALKGDRRVPRHVRPAGILFLGALGLSVTGALDVIPICWMALLVLLPAARLRAVLGLRARPRALVVKILLIVFGAPLAVGVAGLMVWIGYINKIGVEGTTNLIERAGVQPVIEQTMIRVSTSYHAVISFARYNLFNGEVYERSLAVPVENVPYRLSLVLGAELPRPQITQISRLNYLNYEADPFLERAGASPGLVASAFYAAPFPLGFILLAIYVVVIVRLIDTAFANLPHRPTLALVVFCVSFIFPLFESPVDYLVFIDPAFAQLTLTMLALLAAASGKARQVPAHAAARPQRAAALLPIVDSPAAPRGSPAR